MITKNSRIAIVGCTGAVGREMLTIIEQRNFPCDQMRLLASERSAGTELSFRGTTHSVELLTQENLSGIDLALFSVGGSISRKFAPVAVQQGATVIDNSSAFRMDEQIPLIVPEINGYVLNRWAAPGIIANPNCTTIITLMALTPIHRAVGIERMVAGTYQAASGAGAAVMAELQQQAHDYVNKQPYTMGVIGRQYLFNVFSHDSPIDAAGHNEEETKLLRETHKIWNDDQVRISATCVRVPVLQAHSVAINLTLKQQLTVSEARELFDQAQGVSVVDDRANNQFPEPIHAAGQDDVLVGRLRNDPSQEDGKGLSLFVCGDQLRKGAALNAIQIAELLMNLPQAGFE